jgi:hypothetical protein
MPWNSRALPPVGNDTGTLRPGISPDPENLLFVYYIRNFQGGQVGIFIWVLEDVGGLVEGSSDFLTLLVNRVYFIYGATLRRHYAGKEYPNMVDVGQIHYYVICIGEFE